MKKLLTASLLILLCLTACSAPATQTDAAVETETAMPAPSIETPATQTKTAEQAAIDEAQTTDELKTLIAQYRSEENYQAVRLAAIKLTELDPGDPQGYEAAAEALILIAEANYTKIDGILAQGAKNSDAETIADWAQRQDGDLDIDAPFTPDYASEDEVNTEGNSAGNLANATIIGNESCGGLVATQGDWVYFSRIDENFALYKMRMDGSGLVRLGSNRGCSLSVLGDWIYFVDLDNGNMPYRMRTDGSLKTRIADDFSTFIAVTGDWLYYNNGYFGYYKVQTDGMGKTWLRFKWITKLYVSGEWAYCYEPYWTGDGGFYRISTGDSNANDGEDPQYLVDKRLLIGYCIQDDWAYYIIAEDDCAVHRVRTDGSGDEVVFQGDERLTALNIAGDKLIVSAGVYTEGDGIVVGGKLLVLNAESGETLQRLDQHTEVICTGGDWVYFTEFDEGTAWHALNLETGEDITME